MKIDIRWVLASLLLVAGGASAQVNLLPQGSFEHPGLDTEWAEGFRIPNNQEFRTISEDGKHRLRIENRDAGRQLDYVHAYVRVTPQIASLTVSVRMRARNLKVGKEGWHTARVALMFEGGPFGFPPEVPELRGDSDWVTRSVELKVPKGATRLNIQPAMFHCTGVFEIADLTVTPHVASPTQIGDAVLPAGTDLDWEKAKIETVNARRARISLDGVWRFAPAAEGTADPPKLGWGYIKVPGDWQIHQGKRSDFLAPGCGPQWDLYDGSSLARAWYQRQAPIPAEWRGRVIALRFERVCTDAIVQVDGTQCGRIAWPWGSVDITQAVTPGKSADIRLLVAAIADPEKVGSFWQNALSSVSYASAQLETRGLTGSVFLESRASQARVADVFVRPSTRRKDISLDVDLAGVEQPGRVGFVAEMLDEKGAVEKSFSAEAAISAYLEGGGKAFFLPRSQADGWLGTVLKAADTRFAGSRSVPRWPEARGLSASDLRWRSYLDAAPWVLGEGAEIGADGLIGRKTIGKGVAVFCQVDPERFRADEKTYFRYTRWRSTRAVAQLLANLGATFEADGRIFHPLDTWSLDLSGAWQMKVTLRLPAAASDASAAPDPGIYHPDYRTDFPMGDDPYRYYRW